MSEIEGVCDECGLLLPEWVGNRRELCQCEVKRFEKFRLEHSESLKDSLSESQRLIRVIGVMVLAGVIVWMGIAALWFGVFWAGVCLLVSGGLFCLYGLFVLWVGDK